MQFISDNLHFIDECAQSLAPIVEAYQRLRADLPPGSSQATIELIEAAERKADLDFVLGEFPKAVKQSLEGARRVAGIIRAMKHFTHPCGSEPRDVDLHLAIVATLEISRSEYHHVADAVTDFDARLPSVPCVIDEINQVILNRIVNAAHAIRDRIEQKGGRGTITISTRLIEDAAEIRIADTGGGIPEAVRSRIFEPFFTTKGAGQGTGQGLYLAQDIIVKHHGGSLRFETRIGYGTEFIITLPLTRPPHCHRIGRMREPHARAW